jgi:hypothetical protein
MARRSAALLGVLLAFTAWVLPLQPAAATTWSSRSLGHTPFTCSDHSLWVKHYVNVGSTIYAAATDYCGHYSFVTGNPTSGYHIEKTPFGGYKTNADFVDAIVRDGSTTWFLRRNPEFPGRLEIWDRSSTGKYSLFRVLSTAANYAMSGHPDDLVVSGGQWTAAWVQSVKGKYEILLASTLAGHAGHSQSVTPAPAANGDFDPYVTQRTATDAEVFYRSVGTSDDIAVHARHVVQGGFSADRIVQRLTGQIVMMGRVLQRGSTTYFLVNDYTEKTSTYALRLVGDTGSVTHSSTVVSGNYYGQLAVDAATGHLYAAIDVFQSGTYPSLLTNATGVWRSSRLPIGTRDIGFDALTVYSAKPAIYYSPASTYQDTVYYAH